MCEKLFGAALALAEPELRDQIQIISKTGIVCLEAHGMKTTKHYNLTADYILGHVGFILNTSVLFIIYVLYIFLQNINTFFFIY